MWQPIRKSQNKQNMVTVLLSNLVVTWHVEISGVHPHPQPTLEIKLEVE